MNENPKLDEITKIKLELALCYIRRACGKSSHALFRNCVENAQDYLVSAGFHDFAHILSFSNLHYHKPLEDVEKELKKIISEKYADGTMPYIEHLQAKLNYEYEKRYREIQKIIKHNGEKRKKEVE